MPQISQPIVLDKLRQMPVWECGGPVRDYAELAKYDITYFMAAYEACPTCGWKFKDMHPLQNLYPHWTGTCKDSKVEGQ